MIPLYTPFNFRDSNCLVQYSRKISIWSHKACLLKIKGTVPQKLTLMMLCIFSEALSLRIVLRPLKTIFFKGPVCKMLWEKTWIPIHYDWVNSHTEYCFSTRKKMLYIQRIYKNSGKVNELCIQYFSGKNLQQSHSRRIFEVCLIVPNKYNINGIFRLRRRVYTVIYS